MDTAISELQQPGLGVSSLDLAAGFISQRPLSFAGSFRMFRKKSTSSRTNPR